MKPEDREIPAYVSEVSDIPPFAPGRSKPALVIESDGRAVSPDKPSRLDPTTLRDAVLPEYDGTSDEHVLGGKVTSAEALQLFKDHYAKVAPEGTAPQKVEEVSPAEVYGAGGKKIIWLPVLFSRGQMIQRLKANDSRQKHEIEGLKGEVSFYKSQVTLQTKIIERKDELINSLKKEHIARLGELQSDLAEAKRPWWKRIFG